MPLVLCSSKTRPELEELERRLGIAYPFVSENGAAVYLPAGSFPSDLPGAIRRDGYDVIAYGRPYAVLQEALHRVAGELGVGVRGFGDMSAEEVAADCGLPLPLARLAKQREFDEPFRVIDGEPSARLRVHEALRRAGFTVMAGGRYDHVTGGSDKGAATALLRRLYRKACGPVTVVGLGDAPNDVPLLKAVDVPVIVRGPSSITTARVVEQVPWARVTMAEGPAGWSEAVLALVEDHARVWQREVRR